jgi:hypothetical protein
MFPVDYSIKLLLNYCYNKRRGIQLEASLECKESLYILRFKTESDISDIISCDSRDMLPTKVKSVFRIYKAYIGKTNVKVEWGDALITNIRTRQRMGEAFTEREYTINSFVLKTIANDANFSNNQNEDSKVILSKNKLIKGDLKLKASEKDPRCNVYIPHYYRFNGIKYGLFHNVDIDYPQIILESNESSNLRKFIKCLSFYYGCEIDAWLHIESRDNIVVYSYETRKITSSKNSGPDIWHYYQTMDGKKFSFESFISSLNCALCNMEEDAQSVLFKSLRCFTGSHNLSNQHKLTDFCAIILTIAQFMHNFSNCQDIELAKAINSEVNIDFNKVNGDLAVKGIIKTNDGKPIKNYIDLRNEVTHGLPSDIIIEFLNDSFLINRLEHATFVTILYECGFSNLKYCWYYQEFNVLK